MTAQYITVSCEENKPGMDQSDKVAIAKRVKEVIKAFCEKENMSMRKFALKYGFHPSTIQNYITNRVNYSFISKLIEITGASKSYIMCGEPKRDTESLKIETKTNGYRNHIVQLRLTLEDYGMLAVLAEKKGLRLPDYLRTIICEKYEELEATQASEEKE